MVNEVHFEHVNVDLLSEDLMYEFHVRDLTQTGALKQVADHAVKEIKSTVLKKVRKTVMRRIHRMNEKRYSRRRQITMKELTAS